MVRVQSRLPFVSLASPPSSAASCDVRHASPRFSFRLLHAMHASRSFAEPPMRRRPTRGVAFHVCPFARPRVDGISAGCAFLVRRCPIEVHWRAARVTQCRAFTTRVGADCTWFSNHRLPLARQRGRRSGEAEALAGHVVDTGLRGAHRARARSPSTRQRAVLAHRWHAPCGR